MGNGLLKGGKCKKAPYGQANVRCPDPATPQIRALLNLYRELYQNESSETAELFLSKVLTYATDLYVGGGVSSIDANLALITENIKENKQGYRHNGASQLRKDILCITEPTS